MLRLFTPEGLDAVRQEILSRRDAEGFVRGPRVSSFLRDFQWYTDTVETAVGCLQRANFADPGSAGIFGRVHRNHVVGDDDAGLI